MHGKSAFRPRQSVPSASGSRQTCLRHGGLIAKRALDGCRDRLERDQVDAVARGEAFDVGNAGGVAGVAAAGDDQQVGLGAPAVLGSQAERFGRVLDGVDAGVRGPAGDGPGSLVVAVVRRGALVDRAVGTDADLDSLPVVPVKALLTGDRDTTQRGRVGVVGPVLE